MHLSCGLTSQDVITGTACLVNAAPQCVGVERNVVPGVHSQSAPDPPQRLADTQPIVQLMGAWKKLAQRIVQQSGVSCETSNSDAADSKASAVGASALDANSADLLLRALTLAVSCLRSAPPRRNGRTPLERSLELALALMDLRGAGVPLDGVCIAAGLVAEAVELSYVNPAAVEDKLGVSTAALVHDILKVRAAPEIVELYDDKASR
jgi:hypothetical protein